MTARSEVLTSGVVMDENGVIRVDWATVCRHVGCSQTRHNRELIWRGIVTGLYLMGYGIQDPGERWRLGNGEES